MTSQLVLGNGFGVGMASDSAVTLVSSEKPDRTYETAEKIFPLPMPHRLAMLTSGASLLHGLPFDVLLKEWIRSLGDARESQLRSVELYRESFLSWLRDNLDRWATSERRDEEAPTKHQISIRLHAVLNCALRAFCVSAAIERKGSPQFLAVSRIR